MLEQTASIRPESDSGSEFAPGTDFMCDADHTTHLNQGKGSDIMLACILFQLQQGDCLFSPGANDAQSHPAAFQ